MLEHVRLRDGGRLRSEQKPRVAQEAGLDPDGGGQQAQQPARPDVAFGSRQALAAAVAIHGTMVQTRASSGSQSDGGHGVSATGRQPS